MSDTVQGILVVIVVAVVIIVLIIVCMFAFPQYNVWRAGKAGEAELRRAESSKQVMIEEAKAKMESAKLLADAEVERAKGVAEANKIIGDSLKDSESYLRYLWIQGLTEGSNQVVYVPTEAGLPILEATRLKH